MDMGLASTVKSGSVTVLPFIGEPVGPEVEDTFLEVVGKSDVDRILVLTRSPTGVETVEDALAGVKERESQSREIRTLTSHALRTLLRSEADLTVLSPAELNAAIIHYADQYDWETDYLQGASNHLSFYADLRSFVTDAIKLPTPVETDDAVLADLGAFAEEFHRYLLGEGYVAQPAILRMAISQLERGTVESDPYDAVIVTEFEEFAAVDRQYLAAVSAGAHLRCFARRESSLLRVWLETGPITQTTELPVEERPAPTQMNVVNGAAQFLATDSLPPTVDYGQLGRIHGQTFREQIRAIGTKLKQRKRATGLPYDAMAVVFRDATSPVADAIDILWNMGVPVSSATATGMEHDPAARELLQVVRAASALETGDSVPEQVRHALLERLVGSEFVASPEAALERGLKDGDGTASFARTITRWVNETQLKARVSAENDPLIARLTFQHLDAIRSIATFFDGTDLFDSNWDSFEKTLEQEFERAASDQIAADLETTQTGVTVDTVGSLKGSEYKVVFVANVVEGEFPSDASLNRLFPTPRATELDGYPRITNPSWDEIDRTFTPPRPKTSSRYRAYSQARDRRLLAAASNLATRALYFGTYEEERHGTGQMVLPSRYLQQLDEAFGETDVFGEAEDNRTPQRAVLDRVDSLLTQANRAHQSLPDESELAEQFGAIQHVVAETDSAEFEAALESRLDRANGGIGDE